METMEKLVRCELCGKNDEDLSLYSTQHKKLGRIKVCRKCWVKLYDDNNMVAGSSGSSGSSCPTCGL